ncbi:MAG: substrate-binding domain-containing protein [Terrimesophilobacter sp.]
MKFPNRNGLALFAPILVFGLAGCASGGPSSEPGSPEPLRIGAVVAVVNDPFFITMNCGAAQAVKEAGAELNWQGPTGADVAKQLQTFNSMVVTQPDGIMLTPFSDTAFNDGIKKAMASGIPVVIMDSELKENIALQTVRTTIGESVKELARHAAEDIGGTGTVAIIAATPGSPIDLERYDQFIEIMNNEFPDIKVLPVEYAKTDTAISAKIVNSLVVANPDLKLIYSTNGPQAAGVLSAVKAAKKTGAIKIYSYDATPVQVDGLRAGDFQGLLAQSPYIEGYEAAKTLLEYLADHRGEKNIEPYDPQLNLTPMMLLTPDNIDSDDAKKFTYVSSCG